MIIVIDCTQRGNNLYFFPFPIPICIFNSPNIIMNGKRILFSAIITGMIGFVAGVGIAKYGQANETSLKYDRVVYRNWVRSYGRAGFAIGFVVGAGQEYLRQAKKQRDKEL